MSSTTTNPVGANPLDDPSADPAEIAQTAAAEIASATGVARHDIALTLGSGWGKASELLGETVAEVPAAEITGFTASAVVGHSGTLRSVRLADGRHALIIGARTHYYEGHGVRRVVHSVRTAAATGAKIMILTNGAGGIRESWTPGQPVLISDHINLTADSPLEGATFIDLTDLYSKRLRDIARTIDPSLDEGVYCQFRGPHYETPAEVQMAKAIGGHIVGMSTSLEAIAARQSGMEVLGFSLITNLAAGISPEPLSHAEVLEAGRTAEPVISDLLARVVAAL
ncbi:purine-nucleoside phosphorylase [Frondihabitans sp. PhB188]|uniref:purine-nucleoside phosphorylase n=1 Tax=Frondihabitans sp. PhB188 TaxID=2485200 RepID=UPI000F474412|nr:purine-nucleoside phosphorylase [Frondihabitans sp. PhB188]ROQ36675.1 purine-nucleoside phosphorylase [Frondihabitans sp. PhB188]